jgi:tRNA A37 threonylcarbamoyladenosine modification protein TsaB
MKIVLHIDTSKSEEISVVLEAHGKRYEKTLPSRVARAQTVLPLTEKILKEANVSVQEIEEVTVAQGKESYTGVRVGFAIANSLGRFLNVPVSGKKTLAIPDYSGLKWTK